MGQDAADECAAAFAYGFEKGIIMTMLRPEWAQGLYLKLREYYLLTHAPADLAVWEEQAKETCRAMRGYLQHIASGAHRSGPISRRC